MRPISILLRFEGRGENASNFNLYYHPILGHLHIEVGLEVGMRMWPFLNPRNANLSWSSFLNRMSKSKWCLWLGVNLRINTKKTCI
jgi:hypothetical protein